MIRKKGRFILLALLMILLVSSISMFSTYYLYRTAVQEQEKRLQELVQSQASLVAELGWLSLKNNPGGSVEASREEVLDYIGHAHKAFHELDPAGGLIIAKRDGDHINLLIVKGTRVTSESPYHTLPLYSPDVLPLRMALEGKSGTVISTDHRGEEVLAAYIPVPLKDTMLALVAEVDIKTLKAPFFRANITIFVAVFILTGIFFYLFFKVSEPVFEEIRVNEKQYRDLVETAGNFILRVNKKGVITFSNTYANKRLRKGGQSLVGEEFIQFITPEGVTADLEGALSSHRGLGHGRDVPLVFSDGQNGWVSWDVQRVEERGQELELLCIGNDVTVLHLANAAQREVEERFRAIARVSPVGIVITSQDGNLYYANERMHKLTGTEAIDLAGKRWMERIHPDDRKQVVEAWFSDQRRFNTSMEFRMLGIDDSILWVLGQIVDLVNDQKETVGDVISFTDITRIKETELAMRRLSTVVEQMSEIVLITDLDGSITYVNKAFETITGYPRDSVVGKKPNILKSGEQDEAFYRELWETIQGGEMWRGRFVNKRRDGRRYTQEAAIGPIRNNRGKVVNYLAIARDITEELVVEAQLRQSQKLESIGQLAAGIAHEINTPTQYVTTNLQFLEDSYVKYSETIEQCTALIDRLEQHLESLGDDDLSRLVENAVDREEMTFLAEDIPNAIRESSTGLKRIAEIVQSVKQLAHPGEVSKSYYDLNEIVRDAATVSTNEWKYVATVSYDLADGLPQVSCLKGEIGQVVLNLIVNSAHAIEAKRGEDKTYGDIGLKTYLEDDMAVLEVSDTGTGIPQESVDRIFDPFYTTKPVGKGTGQGLAIAHNVIVNMHGGQIDLRTKAGEGSTFIIRLPVDGAT